VPVALTVSQVSRGRKNRLWFEIDGARTSVTFDQEDAERLRVGRRSGIEILTRDPACGAEDMRRLSVLPPGHPQGYADCLNAFIGVSYAAILGEMRPGLPVFRDGARSLAIVEAVLRSSSNGTRETIQSTGVSA
jgi:predicted dehydrogenase